MNNTTDQEVLLKTNISWGEATDPYRRRKIHEGKVRDTYLSDRDDRIVVTTDRVSAFDVIMPFGVPGKGAVLNMLSNYFMKKADQIVRCWASEEGMPHPQVTIGRNCKPFKIEMIVRAYLCGSAWRAYKRGVRTICGVKLPEGLKENDKLPYPVMTPTTKADIGQHDEDITPQAIVESGLCTQIEYHELAGISLKLFQMGALAAERAGMILADTKFELGTFGGKIYLIDELLTPDSSRYFDRKSYDERQPKGEPQEDLSKEYLRKLLMSRGFEGKDGQTVPEITSEEIAEIALRYRNVYERLTARTFENGTGLFSDVIAPTDEAIRSGVDYWFKEHRHEH